MSVKKEIILTAVLLIGVAAVFIAYQCGETFWHWFDSGIVIIALFTVIITKDRFLLHAVTWLFLACTINAWITSTFYDVTQFGMNQQVFAFFISALIASSSLTYCVYKFTVQIKLMELQKQCTKDAKNKYKEVLTKIEHRDSQFDDKIASMTETIKGFEQDGKALKQFIKILENGFEH